MNRLDLAEQDCPAPELASGGKRLLREAEDML